MTRKRFVKLLMSNEVDRNLAQHVAKWVHLSGGNYQEAYYDFLTNLEEDGQND